LGPALKQLNWTSMALALGVVGLELGFLLAYRAGWNISLAALIANIAAALLLIVVGTIFFKEKVSVVNIVGVVVCVVGLIMVNFKS
jgi:multidrug transporter EmrE-like cation transporter